MERDLEALPCPGTPATSRNRLGKPGVLTTMARLSQWALENGYLDSERGKDSSEPPGDQPEESGAAPDPRSKQRVDYGG